MSEISHQPLAVTPARRGILVITTCASRKSVAPSITAQQVERSGQAAVGREWLDQLDSADPVGPASEVYRGRAFALAKKAAAKIEADLGIVSAGLGFVLGSTRIPSYDLTLRGATSGSIRDRVLGAFDPSAWWRTVRKNPYATSLVDGGNGRSLVLICLSREYARMAGGALLDLATATSAIRIFGLNVASGLPPALRRFVLPYDERLNGVGLKGTRVDFPQRALLHYVSHIHPSSRGLAADIEQVEAKLAGVERPCQQVRARESDNAIKQRIRALVRSLGGTRTKILHHLRHAENVSCEQGRFSLLYAQVQDESGGRE